ncbi:uncharacterized protein FIBRA_05583 [Fibroporia radiculosa]|uniref:N-acetyltransferase domain-containing protein n=1 Tax=Fibroporia radiculosa TaxID=599839 RepID=J4GRA2_9APHY|nr:uncharacterized protein FIBRA_05583 [Fibroporia radiculosa]CCM03450.1 predicted protein [Fibroporia radiculosa]
MSTTSSSPTVNVEVSDLPSFPKIWESHPIEHEVFSEDGSVRLRVCRGGIFISATNGWLTISQYFKVKLDLCVEERQIGQLTYRLVNGNYIDDFHEELESSGMGGQQLESLSSFLFNADGTLRETWRIGVQSGTRIFGPELSAKKTKFALLDCCDNPFPGDYLVIEDAIRRRGIASWAVQRLFEQLRAEGVKYILTWPSVPRINPDLRGSATEEQLLQRNLAFVRKVGFRRVGLSPVFAYMLLDDNHPSRTLPKDHDMNPPRPL